MSIFEFVVWFVAAASSLLMLVTAIRNWQQLRRANAFPAPYQWRLEQNAITGIWRAARFHHWERKGNQWEAQYFPEGVFSPTSSDKKVVLDYIDKCEAALATEQAWTRHEYYPNGVSRA